MSAEVPLALRLMSRPATAVSEPLASETDIEAFWLMLVPLVTALAVATVVEALLMSRPAVATNVLRASMVPPMLLMSCAAALT
ncbi:hypothetical protein RC52_07025 [Herbaspirillum rubrisubalbicans]|uniref:Uncharacterized protein n=2 Tax=Herbaspirillum rubrisubalbicans TaxID=80842 RepID=A0A6M3ZPD1_9BURK|nr:hypothetical protein [Herbaspirillum rubrisubalbicans]NQE48228.1 hypothetical protein [Herbaspirillum rubrisubalbicans]QJQ00386.1 hypothetical protein C798_09115 [Herbaspirillum rubrisubalbicans Os34]